MVFNSFWIHVMTNTRPSWLSPDTKAAVRQRTADFMKAKGVPLPDWVEVFPDDYEEPDKASSATICVRWPKHAEPPTSELECCRGNCIICGSEIIYSPPTKDTDSKICCECAEAEGENAATQ